MVDKLKPNTVYEAEVCAICGDQRSEYSNRLEITTRQSTSFNCGQADSSKLPQNQNPLRKLSKGDAFTASTFTVEVSEASGSNGTFTGKGFILVPYLNYIKVEAKFQNIRINEEFQLIGGEVQTVYNIANSLTAKIDGIVKTIQGDGELNPYDAKTIGGKIIKVDSVKTIKVINGQVIVTDVNGKEETATLAKDKLVVVKTQEGGQYVVDGATNTLYTSANSGQKATGGTPTGNVTTASEAGKGSTPQFNVSFLPHTLQKYGYDIPSDKSPAENYETVNITGQPTLVPWKSLEAGRTEYVMAGITGGPADTIRYYRESNNMVMTAPGSSSYVLNAKTAPDQEFKQLLLTGTAENTTDKLFAWYPSHNDDTTKTYSRILAGQLNMASYEKKTIQVVLVPINKSICPDPLYVAEELNRIYKSAVIDWNVTKMPPLDATFAGPVFDNTSPKEHLDYTPDMEAVINQLKASDAYSRDKFYLFFLDNAKDPNIKGFMPFKKQFGFIFKYQQYPDEYMRTIAHELGHGALRLWHTFSSNNQYIQPEGSTNNLMDYVDRNKADSAILLNKYQWDWAHDPTWRIYAFEDQEEAEITTKMIYDDKAQVGGMMDFVRYILDDKSNLDYFNQLMKDYGITDFESIDKSMCVHILEKIFDDKIQIDIPNEAKAILTITYQMYAQMEILSEQDFIIKFVEENPEVDNLDNLIRSSLEKLMFRGIKTGSSKYTQRLLAEIISSYKETKATKIFNCSSDKLKGVLYSMESNQRFKNIMRRVFDVKDGNQLENIMKLKVNGEKISIIEDFLIKEELGQKLPDQKLSKIANYLSFDEIEDNIMERRKLLSSALKVKKFFEITIDNMPIIDAAFFFSRFNQGKESPLSMSSNIVSSLIVNEFKSASMTLTASVAVGVLFIIFDLEVNRIYNETLVGVEDLPVWNNILKWKESKYYSRYNETDLLLQYVSLKGKYNNVIPTSIRILDVEIAKKIFGFEPKFVNYDFPQNGKFTPRHHVPCTLGTIKSSMYGF
jgi:hypothetical protein